MNPLSSEIGPVPPELTFGKSDIKKISEHWVWRKNVAHDNKVHIAKYMWNYYKLGTYDDDTMTTCVNKLIDTIVNDKRWICRDAYGGQDICYENEVETVLEALREIIERWGKK